MSQLHPSATQTLLPDLLARQLNITAVYASGVVNVAAVVENIGYASATGPFRIDVGVTIGGETTYFQSFEVPASVTLSGRPVLEQAFARGIIGSAPVLRTQYTTPAMEVPLLFRDEDPNAIYTAQFIVDEENQIAESNESNNMYTWPGTFWFMSPAAKKAGQRVVIKHPASAASARHVR